MRTLLILLGIALSTQLQAAEVYFEKNGAVPLVRLNIVLKAGSVNDPEGQEGLTRFMSKMLLRGTKKRTKSEIDLALDQLGGTLEVDPRSEVTLFRGAVLARELDPYLDLIHEIFTDPAFPPNEIDKLKKESVSEILNNLSNDRQLAKARFEEILFTGHPFGKPLLGRRSAIEKLTKAQIASHYERIFRDSNLLIVGSGDAPEDLIQAWAKRMSKERAGGQATPAVSPPQPEKKFKVVILDKPDRTQTQIYGGHLGVTMKDDRYFPLYMGIYAFGGSFNSRFMEEIRVKRGWSYGAGSAFNHGSVPRSFLFTLFPASQYTPQALATSLDLIRDLKEKGLTEKEFVQTQSALVNNAGFRYNTPEKRAENTIIEKTLGLPEGFMKTYGTQISGLSRSDVNRALKDFLAPEHMTVLVLATAKDMKGPLAKELKVPEDSILVVPYTQD